MVCDTTFNFVVSKTCVEESEGLHLEIKLKANVGVEWLQAVLLGWFIVRVLAMLLFLCTCAHSAHLACEAMGY